MMRHEMTATTQPAGAPSAPPPSPHWQTCDHCRAPVEETQRYCVACGTRRTAVEDPASRYFAEAARRDRALKSAAATPPGPRKTSPAVAAVILALIPIAAGIGVVVGRGDTSGDEQIIEALRVQRPPVVNVTGGGAGGAVATDAATTKAVAKKSTTKAAAGKTTSDGAKVLATGPGGSARQLAGAKPSAKQLQESKAALQRINSAKGKEYVESQRNLPDQIIIP